MCDLQNVFIVINVLPLMEKYCTHTPRPPKGINILSKYYDQVWKIHILYTFGFHLLL